MAQNANKYAKTAEELTTIARRLGWNTTPSLFEQEELLLSKLSPAGQDFSIELRRSDLIDSLRMRIENFDESQEAYAWLDSSGHGANGAPHKMIDVYNDMAACKKMMKELLKEWEK